MGVRFQFTFAVGCILAAGAGCASSEVHHEITLVRDAQITIGSSKPLTMKKGEKFDLGTEPALIESPGQISILLLPPSQGVGSGKVTVGFKPGQLDENHASEAAANDLIFSVDSIEALLSAGKLVEAETRLADLGGRYPKAGAIKFLRARVSYAHGSRIQGRALFEEAQREFPSLKVDKDYLESAAPRRLPASGARK